jgi:hypothetical protein
MWAGGKWIRIGRVRNLGLVWSLCRINILIKVTTLMGKEMVMESCKSSIPTTLTFI